MTFWDFVITDIIREAKKVTKQPCDHCGGTGRITKSRTYDFDRGGHMFIDSETFGSCHQCKGNGFIMSTIRPILDRLIVRRDPTKDVTRGGIIIPDNAKELSLEGTVVAVGPGKPLDNGRVREPQVKTGDRVLFSKHSGWSFKRREETDSGECFVLEERDVLAVIDP